MERRQYYDRILKEEPANNPPYLTRRGGLSVLGVIALSGLAVWAQAVHDVGHSAFLVGIAASACFVVAFVYAKNLIIWRAIQTDRVRCVCKIDKESLYPGAKFSVQMQLDNVLPMTLHIASIAWDSSHNLSIDAISKPLSIAGSGETELNFEGSALAIGHGTLFGIGLIISDRAGLFRQEVHLELMQRVDVVPHRPDHKDGRRDVDALLNWLEEKLNGANQDGDLEIIRPWQSTDSMRQILWRGFARHGELQTIERSTHREPSLLCVIDGGVYMRLTRPDRSSNLSCCVEYLSRFLPLFETVTLVVYDESHPRLLARQQTAQAAFDALEKWLLATLEWQPPSRNDRNQKEIWSSAANQLYRDFKLYKGVDFLKQSTRPGKIDLKGLVQWAGADMAAKALEKDDAAEAARILHEPYEKMLLSLIRSRCRAPQETLMPDNPVPDLSRALPLIEKAILSGVYNTFVWFSDFAMPLDEPAVRRIGRTLRALDMASLAVLMPMPRHALNFNWRRGELLRNLNRVRLGPDMEIMEMPEGRSKTGAAGVLPWQ